MNALSFPIWNAPLKVNNNLKFFEWFDDDFPLCWIGSVHLESSGVGAFKKAFREGDVASLSTYCDLGRPQLYVIAGTSKKNPAEGLLALFSSSNELLVNDEIIQLKELPEPLKCHDSKFSQKITDEFNKLTSSSTVWRSLISVLFRGNKKKELDVKK